MATSRSSASATARAARLRSAKHRRETAARPGNIARAYQLRVEGLTERQIAARMGIDPRTAHDYVVEALSAGMREIHERGRDFVRLELDRLEQPVKFLQRRLRRGDTDAIREHRGLSESRRKLLGLDAQPDRDVGTADVHITFRFPEASPGTPLGEAEKAEAHADVRPAEDVTATAGDDRRAAPVSVDRHGD